MSKKILITGSAGFIGFHLCKKLIENKFSIIGIDNLNSYYEKKLKEDRLIELKKKSPKNADYIFMKGDLCDIKFISRVFKEHNPRIVINLAAQAGVRYSLENPSSYINSNLVGFGNILECCKNNNIDHLIYASSSSVYGGNKKIPFSENDGVNHPVSLYAATKRANELMAHTYSHLYKLPTSGLRFFTVYGPWGRPDMSYFIFTSKIIKDQPIKIYNNGQMMRDFTYIDDIVDAISRLLNKPPAINNPFDHKKSFASVSWAPYQLFNIGNSSPTNLMTFIKIIEKHVGKKAKKDYLPMQLGDLEATFADIKLLGDWIDFKPKKSLDEGIKEFVNWYRNYYKNH